MVVVMVTAVVVLVMILGSNSVLEQSRVSEALPALALDLFEA